MPNESNKIIPAVSMEVKIIRSRLRRRTVSARMVDGFLVVRAPLMLPQSRLEKIVGDFKQKFARKAVRDRVERQEPPLEFARMLNKQYFGNKLKINSVGYTANQDSRYGCCNYRTGDILISHRVGLMPRWVRKYVLIHEMAHLLEPNHGRAFWDIVGRYKLTERARGYLMAAANRQD